MKTVIVLLKATIEEYEKGSVADADKMLQAAAKLRTETLKAIRLVPAPKANRTSEKS